MLFGLADEAALIRGEPVINLDPKELFRPCRWASAFFLIGSALTCKDFCEASMMDFALWILWILCSFLIGRFTGSCSECSFLGDRTAWSQSWHSSYMRRMTTSSNRWGSRTLVLPVTGSYGPKVWQIWQQLWARAIQLMMSRTRELSCNSGSISFEDVRHVFPFATACFFCHFQQKGQWYYGRVLWGRVCCLSAWNRYCNCKLFFLSVQSRQ